MRPKTHEACDRPWTEHTIDNSRGYPQWVCPPVQNSSRQQVAKSTD